MSLGGPSARPRVADTDEDGAICLSLHRTPISAVITVQDSGIGIAPSDLESVFEKYQRASGDGTRTIQGTGLGLVIAREIVRAHGGSIRAESSGVRRQGTAFIVELPLV